MKKEETNETDQIGEVPMILPSSVKREYEDDFPFEDYHKLIKFIEDNDEV